MANAAFEVGLYDIRMAGVAAWFQVNCPACDAALQVRLFEGNSEVVCAQCDKNFVVQVQEAHLPPTTAQRLPQRKEPQQMRRPVINAYNIFMKRELVKVRKEQPNLTKLAVWLAASARWRDSQNPDNGAHAAHGDDANGGDEIRGRHDAAATGTASNDGQSDDDSSLDAEEVRRVLGGRGSGGGSGRCGARGRPPAAPNPAILRDAQDTLRSGGGPQNLTVPQLKALLAAAGKAVGGSRPDLVSRVSSL